MDYWFTYLGWLVLFGCFEFIYGCDIFTLWLRSRIKTKTKERQRPRNARFLNLVVFDCLLLRLGYVSLEFRSHLSVFQKLFEDNPRLLLKFKFFFNFWSSKICNWKNRSHPSSLPQSRFSPNLRNIPRLFLALFLCLFWYPITNRSPVVPTNYRFFEIPYQNASFPQKIWVSCLSKLYLLCFRNFARVTVSLCKVVIYLFPLISVTVFWRFCIPLVWYRKFDISISANFRYHFSEIPHSACSVSKVWYFYFC